MSLRYHEISERNHRILNPFTADQLMLLGELCHLRAGMRQLDLCCGKAELLCRWSAQWGITGTGVDISPVFLAAARQRAQELHVEERLTFVEADAGSYPILPSEFDLISCIGATWIGGGLAGTLDLMRPALPDRDSLLLVGELYWIDEPPDEAYDAIVEGDRVAYTTLVGTLDRIEAAGLELVEMVLADHHGWDRYVAAQWLTVSDWLRESRHPRGWRDPPAARALPARVPGLWAALLWLGRVRDAAALTLGILWPLNVERLNGQTFNLSTPIAMP